jgi:integrase/recombinase XerD
MKRRVITHAQPLAWLKHLARYQKFLEEHRYAPQTTRTYLCCVAHLAHWMANAGLSVAGCFMPSWQPLTVAALC